MRRYQSVDKPHRPVIAMAMAAALCLTVSGCAGRAVVPRMQPDIFWPDPPEIRRIAFVQAVSKPDDLDIRPGILKRVVDYIGGWTAAPMVSPYGLATDAQSRLYVVDTYLKGVHVFDAAGNHYAFFPADKTLLASPVGIAIDEGRIYITDSRQAAVFVFAVHGGKLLGTIGRDVFKRPTGIAVNPKTSELLVVDTLQSRIFRFDLQNHAAKGSFGADGASPGKFHYPTNICVTRTGHIVVSDALNFRVQVFSPQGGFLFDFGRMGNSPGSFSRPKGVASDSDGNLYVVDGLFDNVQMFDKQGRLLMAFGEHGSGYGDFWLPTGIYIDSDDRIYVSDVSNRRVQIFKYLKEEMSK